MAEEASLAKQMGLGAAEEPHASEIFEALDAEGNIPNTSIVSSNPPLFSTEKE